VETTAYNCALGKEDEIVDFYIDNRNMWACRKGVGIDWWVSVQVHKLDSYLFNQKVDLIKIDVEWMELEVLEWWRETIDKNKPIIMIEIKSIDIHNYLSDIWYKPLFREHKTCLYSYNPI
jgi:FkbM family methyltransferase